jgi:hypothetical protein
MEQKQTRSFLGIWLIDYLEAGAAADAGPVERGAGGGEEAGAHGRRLGAVPAGSACSTRRDANELRLESQLEEQQQQQQSSLLCVWQEAKNRTARKKRKQGEVGWRSALRTGWIGVPYLRG